MRQFWWTVTADCGASDAPGPFLETLNRKGAEADVGGEMVRLGGATDADEARYDVLVDRISHRSWRRRAGHRLGPRQAQRPGRGLRTAESGTSVEA